MHRMKYCKLVWLLRSAVFYLVDGAGILVRAVGAVRPFIAEEPLVNALPIAALELLVWACWLVRLPVGRRLSET